MSFHRACCCGSEPEGACGFLVEYPQCAPSPPAQTFFPARAIAWSGSRSSVRLPTTGDEDWTESGVIAFGIQYGSAPTEQQVIDDNALSGFANIETAQTVSGPFDPPNLFLRVMRAWTRSGTDLFPTQGPRLLVDGGGSLSGQRITQGFNGNACGEVRLDEGSFCPKTERIAISGDATGFSASYSLEPDNPIPGSGFCETVSAQTSVVVSTHRSIIQLPDYWDGPAGYDLCRVPGFAPRPTSGATSASAPPSGNAAAIEAAIGANPLVNCRTCGG